MYILRKYITHTHILNARFENCQNGKKKIQKMEIVKKKKVYVVSNL